MLALSFVMALLGGVRNRVETEAEQIAERAHDLELESQTRANPRAITRHETARLHGPIWSRAIGRTSVSVVLRTHRTEAARWAVPRRSLPGDGSDDDDERTA